MAQVRTGNIYGKIVDEEGNPLPGVTVTLTGSITGTLTSISSATGVFRFLSLPPANDYHIKAELGGFKTLTRGDLVVVLGRNTEISLTMEMGAIEEEVTVVATSPVVAAKKTEIGEHVTRETLQSLPTARDPWVVLQQAPGIMVDRENIGGSESGQQASYFARGGGQDQWSMDGVVITDPSAIASPSYYDFDAFDEIAITTGGADVSIQGGGVNINLVTRRGGNRISLGGRFYVTDSKFQSEHTGADVDEIVQFFADRGQTTPGFNIIRAIKDYGFNMGGPFIKDKAWWWMSYGVQDVKTSVLTGADDDTLLINYAAKINVQPIPENRLELFAHIGQKEKWGRSASYNFPRGWHQTGRYHFGGPVYKIQDEHMFGDSLFVSLKYSFNNAGFNMIPMDDLDQDRLLWWDIDAGWVSRDSYYAYNADRPSHSLYFLGQYFNDDLLGASHEFKLGLEWRQSTGTHYWSSSGNVEIYENYGNRTTVDWDGDGTVDVVPGIRYVTSYRGWRDNNIITGYAAYFSDTITFGRFNLILGLRYDYQTPKVGAFTKTAVEPENGAWANNFDSAVINGVQNFLPGLEIPDCDPEGMTGSSWGFKVFSPRLGLTFDVFGDGKTIAKLSYSRYGQFMGTGWSDYFLPTYTGGWMDFWWMDDGDLIVEPLELWWRGYDPANRYAVIQPFNASGNFVLSTAERDEAEHYMWGSFDPDNPQDIGDLQYTLSDKVGSQIIQEGIFSIEREVLPDFGVALDFTYRRFDHYNWNHRWDGSDISTLQTTKDQYVVAGQIPSTMGGYDTKEASGKDYYLLDASYYPYYTRYMDQRPDYYQDYMSAELRMNKRLSNKWMFAGSFTLQTERRHYGTEGYDDPTNLWALDNKIYAPSMGAASGKINMRIFSHWLLKLSGLYQLPYDFNVSFAFNARQGHVMVEGMTIRDYNSPSGYDTDVWVYFEEFGKLRLPTFWNLNLRLEKVIRAGDYGRIYVMCDLFNVFNADHLNRKYDKDHGRYYPHDGSFVQNATDDMANEVLNPRIFRFGVRFEF